MSLLEDRILRIIELREKGSDNCLIAQELGLDVATIERYYQTVKEDLGKKARSGKTLKTISTEYRFSTIATELVIQHYGIELWSTIKRTKRAMKKRKSIETRIQGINQAISEGASSVKDIADTVGLSQTSVRNYAYRHGIQLPKVKAKGSYQEKISLGSLDNNTRRFMKKEEREKSIREAIQNGTQYIEDVAESLHISPSHCYRLFSRLGIPLLPFRDKKNRYYPAKRKPEIDEIIREGKLKTLEKIGNEIGVTREYIRQYLEVTSQYELCKHTKEERKKVIGKILSQVVSAGHNLASQLEEIGVKSATESEQFARKKTQEYFSNLKKISHKTYDYQIVFSLFEDYYDAQKSGKKVSLETFAQKYDFWTGGVGRIFKQVGLKPLIQGERKKSVVIPPYKKECLERAVELEMNSSDIAYFLEVPFYIVELFFQRYYKGDKQRPQTNHYIQKFGNKTVTYRLASQLYEAIDAGFSEGEIGESYSFNQKVIDFAISEREKINRHIITLLQQLFPDKRVTEPYVTFKRE